jgi:hypothetical protein
MTNKKASARYDGHMTGAPVSVVCQFGGMVVAKDTAAAFGQFGQAADRCGGNHGFFARC